MSKASDGRAQEAAAWFARLSRLSISTEALREFQAWRRDRANAEAYAKVEATWRAAGGLAQDPDIQAATAAALQGRRRPRPRNRPGSHPGAWAPAALAAALAVAALGGWAWLDSRPTYQTGVGEQRLVVLADGSRVRLNTDTALKVRFGPGARRVELARGQAFFEVRHDARRPFVVQADGAEITDLGTQFDVRRTGGGVQVTLLEGEVRVARRGAGDAGAGATLHPNQQLVIDPGGGEALRSVDAAQAASWTSGRVVFHATPLAQAVAEVNRYAERKIVLDGPGALAAQPVSGVFDTGDTTTFVAAVQALFGVQSTVDSDGSVHLAPGAARPAG